MADENIEYIHIEVEVRKNDIASKHDKTECFDKIIASLRGCNVVENVKKIEYAG